MPTVLRESGFEVIIYTKDHLPMHVHIFKAEGELIVNIGNKLTDISIREYYGMQRSDRRQALRLVAGHLIILVEKWREIHG